MGEHVQGLSKELDSPETEQRLVAKAQRSRNVVQGRFGGRGAGVGSDPYFEKMP